LQRGLSISRYRTAKMMNALGLASSQPPKHNYKPAKQPHLEIPNTLARELMSSNLTKYGAVMLPIFGRAIVGRILRL